MHEDNFQGILINILSRTTFNIRRIFIVKVMIDLICNYLSTVALFNLEFVDGHNSNEDHFKFGQNDTAFSPSNNRLLP
jgi:hypothetical protein